MAEQLLVLAADRLLYRGPPVEGGRHRHHALQLALSLGEPLRLDAADGEPALRAEGLIIDADQPHRLWGGAPGLALLFLEPESRVAGQLRAACGLLDRPVQAQPPSAALRQRLAQYGADDDFTALCDHWLQELGLPATALAPTPAPDPRVVAVIERLRARPQRRHTAAVLGREVGLSPDRLMHLFRAATGLPLRRYALWLRLKLALSTALGGASLTEAAHAAGFSDSAHLSHSFRAHFGLPPRFLFSPGNRLVVRFR